MDDLKAPLNYDELHTQYILEQNLELIDQKLSKPDKNGLIKLTALCEILCLEKYIKEYINTRFKNMLDVFYSPEYVKELIEKDQLVIENDKFIRDFIWTFEDVINKYAFKYGLKRQKLIAFKKLIKKYENEDVIDKIFEFVNDKNIAFGNKILDEYFSKTKELSEEEKDILIKEFD